MVPFSLKTEIWQSSPEIERSSCSICKYYCIIPLALSIICFYLYYKFQDQGITYEFKIRSIPGAGYAVGVQVRHRRHKRHIELETFTDIQAAYRKYYDLVERNEEGQSLLKVSD